MKSFTEKLNEQKNVMALREAFEAMVEIGIDINEFVEWFHAKGANDYVNGRFDESFSKWLQSEFQIQERMRSEEEINYLMQRQNEIIRKRANKKNRQYLNQSVIDLEAAIKNLYQRANVSTNINAILGQNLAKNLMTGLNGLRVISRTPKGPDTNGYYDMRKHHRSTGMALGRSAAPEVPAAPAPVTPEVPAAPAPVTPEVPA